MRSFSVVLMFGTVSLVFLAPVSPCTGETVLSFEPLILRPYETALVQNGSCPVGKVLKVTGAIRGLERRKVCISLGTRAGLSTQTTDEAPHRTRLKTWYSSVD